MKDWELWEIWIMFDTFSKTLRFALKQAALGNSQNNKWFKFFPTNMTSSLFSLHIRRIKGQGAVVTGETCWRCDSNIWGLDRTGLRGEDLLLLNKSFGDRTRLPTHPPLGWFISRRRLKGPQSLSPIECTHFHIELKYIRQPSAAQDGPICQAPVSPSRWLPWNLNEPDYN